MVNSRRKGAAGERMWRDVLREAGWTDAKRGQQRSGLEQADVVDGPFHVHFEVKVRERHLMWDAMEQAVRDAKSGQMPIVAAKMNRKPWLCVLRAEDLLRLLQERK